ncbi:MAG TPA: hypothetical protein VLE69_02250 [Candidatus Saccharimonadales bacterium]|nr:hypothetical protein [Candidatus Saccharimonadales bacterium]
MGEGLGEQPVFGVLHHDVASDLVDFVLDQQRETDLFNRYSQAAWDKLGKEKPNLQHYISVQCFEAAPDDPILRERLAGTFMGMLGMLDEAKTTEELEERFGDDIRSLQALDAHEPTGDYTNVTQLPSQSQEVSNTERKKFWQRGRRQKGLGTVAVGTTAAILTLPLLRSLPSSGDDAA